MSLLTDVKAYLAANGQGSNLFMGRLPDTPDGCAALFQYPGLAPVFTHGTSGIDRDRPALQVQVRDKVYATAQTRIDAIYQLLATVVNDSLSGTLYQRITPLAAPFLLARDVNDRTILACNFYCERQLGS